MAETGQKRTWLRLSVGATAPPNLIQVKRSKSPPGYMIRSNGGSMTMTTQSILVLVGIVFVFATFGIIVAWADFYSQGRPKPADEEPAAAKDGPRNLLDDRRFA